MSYMNKNRVFNINICKKNPKENIDNLRHGQI